VSDRFFGAIGCSSSYRRAMGLLVIDSSSSMYPRVHFERVGVVEPRTGLRSTLDAEREHSDM
jgi:hypothetical protein